MASSSSSSTFGLHRAAALGDAEGVRGAFRLGADVNALDATGRTALMCAIAGDKYVLIALPELADALIVASSQLAQC